ncbi:COG1470 family protein [Paractinoplanes durhamensis]|uniref:COG1470 family protein n=1 Tax=Paractinoplanes durhamensis TaxID=113563 RepID=UPI00362D3213
MLFQVFAAVVLAATPLPIADAGKVTWTVQPANASAVDGRRWIERILDPGQQVTEHLAVRNLGTTSAVFALSAADGYLTATGRFNMLSSDKKSTDGGTWIDVQNTITVAPNETRILPFTITVPAGATPGDHPAGIAASVLSSSGTVQIESRVGFRVMLRASGTAQASLAAQGVKARYERSWNPLRSGAIHVTYTVANIGNVRADARASVSVSELFGAHRRDGGAAAGELLPGGNRAADGRIRGVWGLGPVRTTVLLTPAVLGEAGGERRSSRRPPK